MADYTSQFTGAEIDSRLEKAGTAVQPSGLKTVGGQALVGSGDIPVGTQDAVKYSSQSLTPAQKEQARTNIAAASADIETTIQNTVDEYLEEHPTITGTFNNAAKRALVSLLRKVAFIDTHGQDYIDELEGQLFMGELDRIEAVFTQGANVIYDIYSLDKLREYLVVTAFYTDGTSEVVNSYLLSGSLESGTSTITVTFEEATDTFSVTVTGTVKLYMDGNECSSITGGWRTTGFNYGSGSPIVSKETSDLLIQFQAQSDAAVARSWSTTNQINVSSYSKILVEFEGYDETGEGGFWAYWPETLSEADSQTGAYGSDYGSNRNLIGNFYEHDGDVPWPEPGEVYITEKEISTTHTNAYLSLNLNLYKKNNVSYSAGAYIKIRKVVLV